MPLTPLCSDELMVTHKSMSALLF